MTDRQEKHSERLTDESDTESQPLLLPEGVVRCTGLSCPSLMAPPSLCWAPILFHVPLPGEQRQRQGSWPARSHLALPVGAPVGPGVSGGLNTRVQTIVCCTGGRAVVTRRLEQTKEAQVALSSSLGLPFCLGAPQLQPQGQGVGGRG